MIVFNDKNEFLDFVELKFNKDFFTDHFMKFENLIKKYYKNCLS